MASCKPPDDDDDTQHPLAGRYILVNSGSFTGTSNDALFVAGTYSDGQVYLGTLIIADDGAVSIQSLAADFTKSGATNRVDFTVTTPQDPNNPPTNISEIPVSMVRYISTTTDVGEGNKLPFEGSPFTLNFQFPVRSSSFSLASPDSVTIGTDFIGARVSDGATALLKVVR